MAVTATPSTATQRKARSTQPMRSVSVSGSSNYVWGAPVTNPQALQEGVGTDRIASCWFSGGTYTIDVNLTDGQTHQVALYAMDWDQYGNGRTETINVLDAATHAVLDTHNVSSFAAGQYLVWNIKGHVIFQVVNTNGNSNAVLSGIFFGPGTNQGATTLTCSPSGGASYASGLQVSCNSSNPSATFTLMWTSPRGIQYLADSLNGIAATPTLGTGVWTVCAQDTQADAWPSAGGCQSPASYTVRSAPVKTLPLKPLGAPQFAIVDTYYSYSVNNTNNISGSYIGPPVNDGASFVTVMAATNFSVGNAQPISCSMNYGGKNYPASNVSSIIGGFVTVPAGCFGNYPGAPNNGDCVPEPAILPAQNYPWSVTCTDPQGHKSTASGNLNITPCPTSDACSGNGFYCAAGGTCTPIADPKAAIVVSNPTSGQTYQVGQTVDFSGGTVNVDPTLLTLAKITVLMDGNPIASILPDGTYVPPAPLTSAQIGSHQITIVVSRPDLLDINGIPAIIAKTAAIPISVVAGASCSATSDCISNFYCASPGVCQPRPQGAAVLSSPTNNQ